jgi:hypothetical protein
VGLVAALATYYTRSMWCGVAVLSGYGAAQLLPRRVLTDFLGSQVTDLFSVRWLLLVVITAFLAFVVVRVLSVVESDRAKAPTPRAAPTGRWWIPLLISVCLFLFSLYAEYSSRLLYGASVVTPSTSGPNPGAVPVPQPSKSP